MGLPLPCVAVLQIGNCFAPVLVNKSGETDHLPDFIQNDPLLYTKRPSATATARSHATALQTLFHEGLVAFPRPLVSTMITTGSQYRIVEFHTHHIAFVDLKGESPVSPDTIKTIAAGYALGRDYPYVPFLGQAYTDRFNW